MAEPKISTEKLNELVKEGIELTGLSSAKQWQATDKAVAGHSLQSLYHAVRGRLIDGKKYYGHGSWNAYVENEHGVSSVDASRWSNGRLHRVIWLMVKKHPPEKIGWGRANKLGFRGKSLKILKEQAYRSNKPPRKREEKYFGYGTWTKYIEWVRQQEY